MFTVYSGLSGNIMPSLLGWLTKVNKNANVIFSLFVFSRISDATFDNLRIATILLCCFVRCVLTKIHLQVFLDVAKRNVVRMRKEAGRISNVALQKKARKKSSS